MIRLIFDRIRPVRYQYEGDEYEAFQPFVDCKSMVSSKDEYILNFGDMQYFTVPKDNVVYIIENQKEEI